MRLPLLSSYCRGPSHFFLRLAAGTGWQAQHCEDCWSQASTVQNVCTQAFFNDVLWPACHKQLQSALCPVWHVIQSLAANDRPGSGSPLVVLELCVVEVAEGGGCIGPGVGVARAVHVAAAQAVRARQRHHLALVEALQVQGSGMQRNECGAHGDGQTEVLHGDGYVVRS